MKLYLFGGAEIDLPSRSVSILKNLLKETFLKINLPSILHIQFARPFPFPEDKGQWDEGWLGQLMKGTNIKILDARNQQDIEEARGSLIFINGGPERKNLIDSIKNNPLLLRSVLSAPYIVAESAGSMATGEYMRISRTDEGVMKGLGILKGTIIEPHYTERNYKKYIPGDMQK